MLSRPKIILLIIGLGLVSLGCRFSAPTPVALLPTATAMVINQTQTSQALTRIASADKYVTLAVTSTSTPVVRNSTPNEPGPWLLFPDSEGKSLFALDQDTDALYQIDLPSVVQINDIVDGISPNGTRLLIRAANTDSPGDLALYEVRSPLAPAEKITQLLSEDVAKALSDPNAVEPHAILRAVSEQQGISWSHDGKAAVFSADLFGASSDLYQYDPVTHSIRWLNRRYGQVFSPLWAPNQKWVVFQEARTANAISDWKVTLVAGLSMPDISTTRYLYAPPENSLGEVFIGWIDQLNLLTYTITDLGNANLRMSNLHGRGTTVLFEGVFKEFALKPVSNNLAVIVDPETASMSQRYPGIYFSEHASEVKSLLLAGDYNNLFYSPELELFFASSESGTVAFDETGVAFSLPDVEHVNVSGTKNWWVAWGINGAFLYNRDGVKLQQLTTNTVEMVVWQKDSQGFYLLQSDGLYHYQFPLLKSLMVCEDVYHAKNVPFSWLFEN